jgi:hypothetical protein
LMCNLRGGYHQTIPNVQMEGRSPQSIQQ